MTISNKTKKTFSEKVLEQLKKIPKGKITTYKEIAMALGRPNSSRAVGNACNKNPFPVKIPCHRVVLSNGKIGGYAKGKKKKIELLEREGIKVKNDKIIDFEEKLFKFGKKNKKDCSAWNKLERLMFKGPKTNCVEEIDLMQ